MLPYRQARQSGVAMAPAEEGWQLWLRHDADSEVHSPGRPFARSAPEGEAHSGYGRLLVCEVTLRLLASRRSVQLSVALVSVPEMVLQGGQ